MFFLGEKRPPELRARIFMQENSVSATVFGNKQRYEQEVEVQRIAKAG